MTKNLAASTLLLLATSASSQTAPDALQQTLQAAQRRDQLEMAGGTPFHLHATFDVISFDGKPPVKGSLDELWEDAHHWRQEIHLGNQVLVEIDNETGGWRTGTWSIPASVAVGIDSLLRPFNYPPPSTQRLETAKDRLAAVNPNYECIGAEPDLPNVAPEVKLAQTTYCLARGNHLLHLIERPDWGIAFNDVQPFEKKYVARTIELFRHGAVYLRLHVDALTVASDFTVLDMSRPETAQRIPFHRADLSPDQSTQIVHGQLLLLTAPMRPPLGHEGKVSLKIHIDTSGAVDSAVVTSSANKFLDEAAVLTVKQWRYRVSYQGDHVVAVDDVASVDFQQ